MKKVLMALVAVALLFTSCGKAQTAVDKETIKGLALAEAETYCKGKYVTADKYAIGGIKSTVVTGTEAIVKVDVVVTEPGAGAPVPQNKIVQIVFEKNTAGTWEQKNIILE